MKKNEVSKLADSFCIDLEETDFYFNALLLSQGQNVLIKKFKTFSDKLVKNYNKDKTLCSWCSICSCSLLLALSEVLNASTLFIL